MSLRVLQLVVPCLPVPSSVLVQELGCLPPHWVGAAPQPFHGGDGPRMLCHGGSSFWFKHAVLAWAFGQRRPRRPHLHLAAEFDKRYRCRAVRDQLHRPEGLQVVQYERLAFLLGTEPGPAW